MSFKKGFTLIELLVVVAIVSLLSSIVMVSLNSARLKARNALRISQVEQLRNAFNLALSDGPLPNVSYAYPCISASCYEAFSGYAADATVDAYLAPYINKPEDPSGGTRGLGGFLYLTPDNWPGTPPFLPGYYIDYFLEPGASNCGPGVLHTTASNYLGCFIQLD